MNNLISEELIQKIKQNSFEKPDFIVEDIETIDFKERNGSLVIDRTYQRNFLQNEKDVSRYAESVFLGLIIPEIQVYENYEKGYREIVDGQQRVLSLLSFLRGECKLRGLKYLTKLNGMYFKDLPPELQSVYKQFGVNMRVAKNPNGDYKYLLFERLNLGSKALNQQEIRNCVFKDNELLKLTKHISANNKDIIRLFEELCRLKNERFLRDEHILNILALMHGDTSKLRTSLKDRVNEYMLKTNDLTKQEAEEILNELLELVELCLSSFTDNLYNAYLARKSVLESVLLALYKFNNNEFIKNNAEIVEVAMSEALESYEYFSSMSLGESQSNKEVAKRALIVLKAIESCVD